MFSDTENPAWEDLPECFAQGFRDFFSGDVGLDGLRRIIGNFLTENGEASEAVHEILVCALGAGQIGRDSFESLSAEVDRLTISEDVVTDIPAVDSSSATKATGLDMPADNQPPSELQSSSLEPLHQDTRQSEETDEFPLYPEEPGAKNGKSAARPTEQQSAGNSSGQSIPTLTDRAVNHAETGYPAIGDVLRGRFQLTEKIGNRSNSEIYKAVDKLRREADAAEPRIALKLIRKTDNRFDTTVKALQHEAECGQRLAHPNVLRIYDIDRDNGIPFLTMEWLDGNSIATLLDERGAQPLEEKQAVSVIECIGDALAYAHCQNIVHGDIKPGNILITQDGQPKLLDFGTAIVEDPGNEDPPEHNGFAHTPAYASCEVLEGDTPTAQDDLFSFACVAYRMLRGQRPFELLTALEAEAGHKQPGPVPGLNSSQQRALRQALAFRREQRTTDLDTFLKDFFAAPPPLAEPARAIEDRPAAIQPYNPIMTWLRPRIKAALPAATAFAITLYFLG